VNRIATADDAAAIVSIYNHYIRSSIATFETEEISPTDMAARMAGVQQQYPFIVREVDERIIGYAYAAQWKVRNAYRFTAESTVYVEPGSAGRGHGSALYADLISRVRSVGVHAVVAGIALPNPASVGLHESLGFDQVAHFRQTGYKFNAWIDVGYWELILEPTATEEDR